jgi:hypothetical protein
MSYVNNLRHTFIGDASDNTPEGGIIRAGGKHVTKTITLSANATSANVNVFLLSGGTIEVMGMHGFISSITTLTNCTNVYFDLWDGTTSVPLTKTTGASLSGYGLGSFFLKNADASLELSTINNNQGRLTEGATGTKAFMNFLISSKLSTNTYVRFNYTTTDAPINAQVTIHIAYSDLNSGVITAV